MQLFFLFFLPSLCTFFHIPSCPISLAIDILLYHVRALVNWCHQIASICSSIAVVQYLWHQLFHQRDLLVQDTVSFLLRGKWSLSFVHDSKHFGYLMSWVGLIFCHNVKDASIPFAEFLTHFCGWFLTQNECSPSELVGQGFN